MSPDIAAAVAVMALFFILALVYATAVVTRGRRERRQFDLDMALAEGKIQANRARSPYYAARHAATRPRTASAGPGQPGKSAGDGAGLGARRSARSPAPPRVVTTATTAGSIAPVIWPGPGTAIPVRPQAASHPGRPTAALDALTDTGWMRAIEGDTNQFIHEMRHEQEQYRKGLRSHVAACARPREGGPGASQPGSRAPRPTSLLRDADDGTEAAS